MDKIPPGMFRYDNKPVFVTWPKTDGRWHIWGPEDKCLIGDVVRVEKFSEPGEVEYCEILGHVADRMVKKRDGGEVRFVMCTFDHAMEED